MSDANNSVAKRVSAGMRIKRFAAGGKRTLLSAKAANELVDVLNALLNGAVVEGPENKLIISEGRIVFQVKTGTGGMTLPLREFQFKDANDNCILKRIFIYATEPEVV